MNDGIYSDITIEDYHASSYISATSIKEAKVSLKQFNWFRKGLMPKPAGGHFDFGNAFELALLDRVNFEKKVAILQTQYWTEEALKEKPELKSPKLSATYKKLEGQFLAENEGKYIIQDVGFQSFEAIEHMLTACYSDPTIRKLIEGTEYQLSIFWTDPETGLKLKTRPDVCKRKKNVIVNLKTTLDGSPAKFSRDLANFDYPLQACVEIRGCIDGGLMDRVDNYFWLVVEKQPPYNAVIYEFDKADMDICMSEYRYLVNKIAQAMEKNEYPGYQAEADNQHGILQARIPSYYIT